MELCARRFISLARTDIARDLGSADDAACRVLDRRHHQRNVNVASVFVPPYGFHLDRFARANTTEQPLLFAEPVGRDDQLYRSSYCLGRGVAEQAFCSAVPRRDHAVQPFAHNRIVRRFDDRREPLRRTFRLLEDDVRLRTLDRECDLRSDEVRELQLVGR